MSVAADGWTKLRPHGMGQSWQAIVEPYGPSLSVDLQEAIRLNASGRKADSTARSACRFLAWLWKDDQAPSRRLADELAGGGRPGAVPRRDHALVSAALVRWLEVEKRTGSLRPITLTDYGRDAARALEWLGALDDRAYPRFQRAAFPLADGEVGETSLASLDLDECAGLVGATRERHAIEAVRSAALAEFDHFEAVFRFGQRVLSSATAPRLADPTAYAAVRRLLLAEHASWSSTGRSLFDPKMRNADSMVSLPGEMMAEMTWTSAGLPLNRGEPLFPPNAHSGRYRVVANLVTACLGPTIGSTFAMAKAFCCDTGWNRQPILDMPRDPVVFRTHDAFGVATGAFISSFKTRARHEVLALIGHGRSLSSSLEEEVRAEWRAETERFDPTGLTDGYAILPQDRGSLELLERYRVMTDAARGFDLEKRFDDSFFLYLTFNHGVRRAKEMAPLVSPNRRLHLSKGATFPAIRKTFLRLKLKEVGSVAAVRPNAGHSGLNVLMPHYLNSEEINAELDQSIRFFQNAVQSLVLRNRCPDEVRVRLPEGDLLWFRRLARLSGIAAALGVTETRPAPGEPATLYFAPTRDNLRDLFLNHLALRLARSRMDPGRWRAQCLPLLAQLKAIGWALFGKGLGSAYVRAAREAHRDLLEGRVALPPVCGC